MKYIVIISFLLFSCKKDGEIISGDWTITKTIQNGIGYRQNTPISFYNDGTFMYGGSVGHFDIIGNRIYFKGSDCGYEFVLRGNELVIYYKIDEQIFNDGCNSFYKTCTTVLNR